jgi:transketolase
MIGIAAGLTIEVKSHLQEPSLTSLQEECMTRFVNQSLTLIKKKICASHAGLTLGEDGATHQTEDIGLMKMLPGMTVINTCDYNQTKATLALSDHHGPAYLRFDAL